MKYEKNQYSEGVSFCSLIIAGAFLYWGITSVIEGSWTGLFLILIGGSIASGQYYAYINRDKLKTLILNEFAANPKATIEEIYKNTGISKKDIKAIILDLKEEGKLLGTFSSNTGQFEVVKINAPESLSGVVPATDATSNKQFCKSCGTKLDLADAKYCQYCGSEI